jgi:hypothetical protein
MLGFSLGKLLELAVIILIVWYGFKFASRVQAVRAAHQRERTSPPRPSAPPIQAEDLVRCAPCGSYVAAQGAAACARTDCPWGR